MTKIKIVQGHPHQGMSLDAEADIDRQRVRPTSLADLVGFGHGDAWRGGCRKI